MTRSGRCWRKSRSPWPPSPARSVRNPARSSAYAIGVRDRLVVLDDQDGLGGGHDADSRPRARPTRGAPAVSSAGDDGGRAADAHDADPARGARYRLDELIGRGGMASVWRATDTVLGRDVAVKRLHAGLLADEEHAERFRREALLVARLSHPNLVHLLDRGEDDHGPYLVMELVEGENLKTRVRREGALPPAEAARICAQVGRALAYAQAQGVVHRDIKAQNVLVTGDGAVKLTDFGIARSIESDGQGGLTRTDMLVGSADYLSPEQADGRPVDARTDVYSLGIVLYECLTGELPFRGDAFVAVAMKHCSEPLPDPRSVNPAVPGLAGRGHHARRGQGPGAALPGRGEHGGRPRVGRRRRHGRHPHGRARRRRAGDARRRHRAHPAPPPRPPAVGRRGRRAVAAARDRGVRALRPAVGRRRVAGLGGGGDAEVRRGARLRPPGRRPERAARPASARRSTATPRPPGTPRTTRSARSSAGSRTAWAC